MPKTMLQIGTERTWWFRLFKMPMFWLLSWAVALGFMSFDRSLEYVNAILDRGLSVKVGQCRITSD